MNSKTELIYELTWVTRRLFQQLRGFSEQMLEAYGINPSQRAVLEFLHRDGQRTVSEMARKRNVSRQHIQVTVNALMARELVTARDNPLHKRSPLIAMTDKGSRLFAGIEAEESRFLSAIETGFDEADLVISIKTLKRVQECLKSLS